MKKRNLKPVVVTVLMLASLLSFAYVNTGTCSQVLTATGLTLPTTEQLPEGKTELPDIEFGKQIFMAFKKMLSAGRFLFKIKLSLAQKKSRHKFKHLKFLHLDTTRFC